MLQEFIVPKCFILIVFFYHGNPLWENQGQVERNSAAQPMVESNKTQPMPTCTFICASALFFFFYSGEVSNPLNVWNSCSCSSGSHFVNSPLVTSFFLFLPSAPTSSPPSTCSFSPASEHLLNSQSFLFIKNKGEKERKDEQNNMSTIRMKKHYYLLIIIIFHSILTLTLLCSSPEADTEFGMYSSSPWFYIYIIYM